MRQTGQFFIRVLRCKQDYGIMIMVDKRFAQKSKLQKKMHLWIYKLLDDVQILLMRLSSRFLQINGTTF
ncbi:unnamed protein product [Paramecium octaurelia]|uniref:ATP-dependent helicase C-terminal domain-containing protein n=1 Tax=Paramecium octaurelia TaxID=43137 RepID=A0A8S1XND6_PAROT|nr:unnamed protein product [Paramecium octaurelia]